MNDLLTILTGDAADKLSGLPGGFIQLAVTSPPYDKLRTAYASDFNFPGVASQLFRVLCDGGVLCWNVGDSMVGGSETTTSCEQKIIFRKTGFLIHDTMIYERLNFSAPESIRYHQAFEYVFILSKGRPMTFNPLLDRRNVYGGRTAFGQNTKRQADGSMKAKDKTTYAEFGMRTNVWRGKTRGQEDPCQPLPHPAMMPKWLARDLILSWSNPGDLVMDPFLGSGTVAMMALQTGRRAIGIDISPEYCELARQQCTQITPGLALA